MVLMPAWFAFLVQLLDQRERKTGQPLVAYPSMPTFHAALDGKAGRDQQQSNGGEVTDISAVCRSETRTAPFGKGSTITSPMATRPA
jgi:hypothetical protein